MTQGLAKNFLMTNGLIFTSQLIFNLYKKFKNEFNQDVLDLIAYIQVVAVERCHGQLRGNYQWKHASSFYWCFRASDMNDLQADRSRSSMTPAEKRLLSFLVNCVLSLLRRWFCLLIPISDWRSTRHFSRHQYKHIA